ncbi:MULTISPECIES: CoA-binding protein [Pontibacillus]|uniref:CoA-binding protein n=1 Tax=Pontibacillus chungwhensis TaxID=265426 RepID=A0ABY8V378_9BACI|nr:MULTISPECIES: CoA-binding protein [Pontibacillus]MCD5322814.1 CoA-binding protein [Pontibacillus sp. HN14]WIG00084.1 CoA-binding protein [Pontibacillus chungwhensis]
MRNPSNEEIKDILSQTKTIAVVGLSDRPERTSYQVSKAMQDAGYRIIPVNPTIEESLGERAVSSLSEIEEPFDLINVFRRSEFLPEVAREAVQTEAKVFWAQQGVQDEDTFRYLSEQGMTVLMDLCIKVAHSVTIGR